MPNRPTRRTFIKHLSVAGLAMPTAIPTLVRAKPANSKLNIAFIATGGKGGTHVGIIHKFDENCTAYCDVDVTRQSSAAGGWPNAKGYQDFRKMYDEQHRHIDAVFVSTPDHQHYPAAMIALKLDKAVYCQKPLTWSVAEARRLAAEAAKRKLPTQMGNQGHAGEGWRILVEWVRSGAIGDVTEVHSWTNRPIWPQGVGRPADSDPIPSTLDWESWIGPAPMRGYKEGVYHSFNWRGWWDFGAGALGDMACHTMDGMFWALEPDAPTSIDVLSTTGHNHDSFPSGSTIKWEFPAKGSRPAFAGYWYDGIKPGGKPDEWNQPARPAELEEGRDMPRTGNLFVGTKGKILVSGDYGDSPRIIPEAKLREIGKPPKTLERAPQVGSLEENHHMEFIMAAKGEKPYDFPKSNFSYAGPMTETIQLGNVALRVGRKIEWDAKNLRVTNLPEANRYIDRKPAKGWDVD